MFGKRSLVRTGKSKRAIGAQGVLALSVLASILAMPASAGSGTKIECAIDLEGSITHIVIFQESGKTEVWGFYQGLRPRGDKKTEFHGIVRGAGDGSNDSVYYISFSKSYEGQPLGCTWRRKVSASLRLNTTTPQDAILGIIDQVQTKKDDVSGDPPARVKCEDVEVSSYSAFDLKPICTVGPR